MMAVRDDLAISNGAACTSASYAPSHVLQAMGLDEERITSSVRISWGPGVKEGWISAILAAIADLWIADRVA